MQVETYEMGSGGLSFQAATDRQGYAHFAMRFRPYPPMKGVSHLPARRGLTLQPIGPFWIVAHERGVIVYRAKTRCDDEMECLFAALEEANVAYSRICRGLTALGLEEEEDLLEE